MTTQDIWNCVVKHRTMTATAVLCASFISLVAIHKERQREYSSIPTVEWFAAHPDILRASLDVCRRDADRVMVRHAQAGCRNAQTAEAVSR